MTKSFILLCTCLSSLLLAAQARWMPPLGDSYVSVLKQLRHDPRTEEMQITEVAGKVIVVQYFSQRMVYEFDSAGCYGVMTETCVTSAHTALERYEEAVANALSSGAAMETSDFVGMYERHFVGIRPDGVYAVSLDRSGQGPYAVRTVIRQPSLMPLPLRDGLDMLALREYQ